VTISWPVWRLSMQRTYAATASRGLPLTQSSHRYALWPGPLDVEIELVYTTEAARALVAVATAADRDASVFHLPGARTTPRQFVELVYQAAVRKPRVFSVPRCLLSHWRRVQRDLAWRGRHWAPVEASDPARRREVYGVLWRGTSDAARRGDRDNDRVASRPSRAPPAGLTAAWLTLYVRRCGAPSKKWLPANRRPGAAPGLSARHSVRHALLGCRLRAIRRASSLGALAQSR
jgi:hypothetical protein